MSDGTGGNNPCINRTQSCETYGNVRGFVEGSNRSKQKGPPYYGRPLYVCYIC